VINAIENLSRVLEAEQKRSGATLFLRRKEMMSARRLLAHVRRVARDRVPHRELGRRVLHGSVSRTAEQTTQNCCWSLGRDCCCHSLTHRQRCAALGWARPQDIPFGLLRVIRLDAESHQPLADTFILIRILRPQRFREGVPHLLKMTMVLREAHFSGCASCRPVSRHRRAPMSDRRAA